MQYTNFTWRNAQPYSDMFDDIYYSLNEGEAISGENEFSHVFFKHNGLPQRWSGRTNFVIAELGFGSGLNCLLTIREWLKHCAEQAESKTLHYIAIEKHPLSTDAITELLACYPELKPYCDELTASYPPAIATTHSRHLFDNKVVIHYKFMDAYEALKDQRMRVDAWYLDGFSPAKNSTMWSEQLFIQIAENSGDGSTCSTYTAAGFVKRNLQNAGFIVKKVRGFGKKREMLTAEFKATKNKKFSFSDKPWFNQTEKVDVAEKKVTIIGAGIAGLTTAYALVKRGWAVTIIDKCKGIANEASSNPAAIVYPRLSINNDIDTEFYTAAYWSNNHSLRVLQEKHQSTFWFDSGLLQLMDKNRVSAIIEKFQFNSEYVSIVEQSANEGVPSVFDELSEKQSDKNIFIEYKAAGVVLPEILCEALKQECGKQLKIVQSEITNIKKTGDQWQCLSASNLINEAEVLIIANGTGLNNLSELFSFPVECIRGQVAILKASNASEKIEQAVNAGVYITPAIKGKHYLGATYSRKGLALEPDSDENNELFNALDNTYPGMFNHDDCNETWVGVRTMSKDRVAIVGAVPDKAFFNDKYADLCHGKTKKHYPPAKHLAGLYVSAAHGSRGFTNSFLSAEIVASLINGEPVPVSKKVMDYLSPSRFIVNDLKRR